MPLLKEFPFELGQLNAGYQPVHCPGDVPLSTAYSRFIKMR